MKINYHKNEVFVIGEEEQIQVEIAERLNCKLGQFPLTYLGIPIQIRKLRKCDLQVLNVKMGKRVEPWQGKLLSSGGRLILVKSCLSSIPTYLMGFYYLSDGQHRELDSIRGSFFCKEEAPLSSTIWLNGSVWLHQRNLVGWASLILGG
jgi:hypothetical protein